MFGTPRDRVKLKHERGTGGLALDSDDDGSP
jgi:hypothetical protein